MHVLLAKRGRCIPAVINYLISPRDLSATLVYELLWTSSQTSSFHTPTSFHPHSWGTLSPSSTLLCLVEHLHSAGLLILFLPQHNSTTFSQPPQEVPPICRGYPQSVLSTWRSTSAKNNKARWAARKEYQNMILSSRGSLLVTEGTNPRRWVPRGPSPTDS